MRDDPVIHDGTNMGTARGAALKLAEMTRLYRALRQPIMGSPKQLRDHDVAEREARFQCANAAMLWLWHYERHTSPDHAPEKE